MLASAVEGNGGPVEAAVVGSEQLGGGQVRFCLDSDRPGAALADGLEPGESETAGGPAAGVPVAAAVGSSGSQGPGCTPPVAGVGECNDARGQLQPHRFGPRPAAVRRPVYVFGPTQEASERADDRGAVRKDGRDFDIAE